MHGTNLQGRDSTSLRHARFIFIYLRIYNCCVLVYFINYSHNLNLNLNLNLSFKYVSGVPWVAVAAYLSD